VPYRMHLLSPHDAPDTFAEDWPGSGVGWRLFCTRPPGRWSLTRNDDAHLQMRLTPPREWPLGRAAHRPASEVSATNASGCRWADGHSPVVSWATLSTCVLLVLRKNF
jgi:hypothetical protein